MRETEENQGVKFRVGFQGGFLRMPFLLPPYFSTLYIHTLKKKVGIFTQGLKIYDLVSRVLFYFLVFLLRLVPVSSVKIIQHSLLL